MGKGTFLYTNIAPLATVTVTSEATNFEKKFLVDKILGTVHRSTAITTQNLTFTFTVAKTLKGVVVAKHNIVAGDTQFKLQGSDDNFATTPDEVNLDKVSPSVKLLTTPWSRLAYRIVEQKASGSYIETGEVLLLSDKYEMDRNYNWEGGKPLEIYKTSVTTANGQRFSRLRWKRRKFAMLVEAASDAQLAILETIAQENYCYFLPNGEGYAGYMGALDIGNTEEMGFNQNNISLQFTESPE